MHIARASLLLFSLALILPAQSPDKPGKPGDLLMRIRLAAQRNLTRLPNFTCLETIERSRRRLPARRYDLIDIARVEVALVEGKELFAWPGSGQFDDRELRDLIPGGATGNGSFALHARAVFLGRHTTFEDLGDTQFDGQPAHHYRYTVPQPFSGFTIRNGNRSAVVGYTGEFWIQRSNLDLLKLSVRGVDLLAELEISDHQEILTYQRLPIGESDFLLPQSSDLILADAGGVESRNRTSFSGCKQYGVASTISFDAPGEEASAATTLAASRPPLPAGLQIELDLPPLELGKTAVGDALTARVVRDVKRDKQILLPKGALLKGRVISFERKGQARVASQYYDTVFAGFAFDEVVTPQWKAPIYGTLRAMQVAPDPRLGRGNQDLGMVVTDYHPSGHNLVVVYNDLRLKNGIRVVWETRSGPLTPPAPK
jgi:hypothetical protein